MYLSFHKYFFSCKVHKTNVMELFHFLLKTILVFFTIALSIEGQATTEQDVYILPDIAFPSNYTITLNFISEINETKNWFSGNIAIGFTTKEKSQVLYLNCKNLEFSTENVTIDGENIVERIVSNDKTEICEIHFNTELESEMEYVLEISFKGIITDNPDGIWENYYTDDYKTIK